MKPEKRFTTVLLSSSQLRKLRTGQMRLPVRSAKPVELQYKTSTEPVEIEYLISERLSDLAKATGSDFAGLVKVYEQVMDSGALSAADLIEIQNRGIPMLSELAKIYNTNAEQVSKYIKAKKVTFSDVKQAILSLTSDDRAFGGRKAPVEVLPELPREPAVGKFYMYRGQKVLCISRTGCDVCARGDEPTCRGLVNCNPSTRADEKSIQLLAVD